MSFDFLAAVKNIAPMLVGTLASPVAGIALKGLLDVLSPDQAAAVSASEQQGGVEGAVAKLGELFQQGALTSAQVKQAELTHKERMAELGYKSVADLARIDADDRASARQREVAVKDSVPAWLAFAVTLGFFAVLGWIIYRGVPATDAGHDAVMMLLGSLGTAWTGVVAYYFGSSASSKVKDKTLADIATGP